MAKSSSLLSTTESVRKYLKYFAIFAVVVIVAQICLSTITSNTQRAAITAGNRFYSEIDNKFGVVAEPAIPRLSISGSPVYSVDNILPSPVDGGVNVYKIAQPVEEYDSEGNAVAVARNFGFTSTHIPGADGQLTWAENGRTLNYNKVSQKWSYRNTALNPPAEFTGFSDDVSIYQKQAASLVSSLGFKVPNLDLENIGIEYLTKRGNSFVDANSPTTARFLKIKVYRKFVAQSLKTDAAGKPLPEIPKELKSISANVYTGNYLFGAPFDLIVTAGKNGQLSREFVYSLDFNNWVFEKAPGVYKLLTPTEAWAKVGEGKGYLRSLAEMGRRKLEVGTIEGQEVLGFTASYQQLELAYIEPEVWTESGGYLVPIYIFRGKARLANSPTVDNADFVYYVNALADQTAQ